MSSLDAIHRAVEMTARCKEVDYDWRAPEDSRYTARMWCNDVGEVIHAVGPDTWTAVQAVHALAAMYERDPSLYKR